MNRYIDRYGNRWDVNQLVATCDDQSARLIPLVIDDLELAIAQWKTRGEEIERLQAHIDRCHDWRKYALAWEDWGDGEPVAKPQRSRFGL